MQFIISKNRETILLGPIDWKPRFIQSEFDELYDQDEISFRYNVPPANEGYLNVGEGFEILPISGASSPSINHDLEHPVGPTYQYNDDNTVTQIWDKTDKTLDEIKSVIKTIAATIRYTNEVSGSNTDISGQTVTIPTTRQSSSSLLQTFISMNDDDTISWKFAEGWVTLTKSDVQNVLSTIHSHVQNQFQWENDTISTVENISDISQLKGFYNSLINTTNNTPNIPQQ